MDRLPRHLEHVRLRHIPDVDGEPTRARVVAVDFRRTLAETLTHDGYTHYLPIADLDADPSAEAESAA